MCAPVRSPRRWRRRRCTRRPAATASWSGSSRRSTPTSRCAPGGTWRRSQSERLGMSDHSWVHVQVVLNISLRLLRLLVKGGIEPAMVTRPRHARPRRRGGGRGRRAAARRRHVDPPRRSRGLQPLHGPGPAPVAARRVLRRAGAHGRQRRDPARDHRPPPPRRALHGRGRGGARGRRARHGRGALANPGRGRPVRDPRPVRGGDRQGQHRGRRGAPGQDRDRDEQLGRASSRSTICSPRSCAGPRSRATSRWSPRWRGRPRSACCRRSGSSRLRHQIAATSGR